MPPKDKDNDMKITFEGGTFSMGNNDGWIPSDGIQNCLLYTSPSPRDGLLARMPSYA